MMVLQKNKGCRSYLEISDIGRQESFICRMLINNTFKSIPECEYRDIDGKKSLLYRIDGMSTLSAKYGRISPEIGQVRRLLGDIADALKEIEEYMMNPNDLVINLKSIVYDNISDKHKLLYVPDSDGGFIKQVKGLIEEIMMIFDHKDREGTIQLYDLYSKILPDNFTPEMFKEMDFRVNTGIDGADCPNEGEDIFFQKFSENTYSQSSGEITDFRIEKNEDYINSDEIGDTANKAIMKKIVIMGGIVIGLGIIAMILLGFKGVILSLLMIAAFSFYAISSIRKEEETEIERNIRQTEEKSPINMRMRNDETMDHKSREKKEISSLIPFAREKESPIYINDDDEIKIGRQAETCEYCISEPGISRIHAVLRKKNRKVVIKDEGSTNGTYVNNCRLTGTEKELNYGDVISFAGIEYYCV